MDEEERKANSDLFWLLLEQGMEKANQLDVDEPLLEMPEREELH